MRFHIGFSKFIKPSRLLYWLGLAFVGLLAWLGLTQQEVYASQTFDDFKLCSYINPNYDISYSRYRAGTITHSNKYTYNSETSSYFYYCNNNDPVRDYATLNQYFTSVLIAVGPNANANEDVWQSFKVPINYTFCSNVADTNSLDLFIPLKTDSVNTINNRLSNSYFNNYYSQITSLSDVISVYVTPHYSNEVEPLPSYACHIDSNDNSSDYYNITCSGVPYDNTVTSYSLDFYNNIYQTFENKNNVYYVNSSIGYDDYRVYANMSLNKYIDYQCSYVEPVQPDQPLFPEDSTGSSDVTINEDCDGTDCINSNITKDNLDLGFFNELDIPQSITDLILLPLRLVDILANDSLGICQPLTIDLSSITYRWGGFNYSLSIPCMRIFLGDLLNQKIIGNITLYVLADMLMAFGLTIWLGQKIWLVINDMLSGHDLHDYLVIDHKRDFKR